ncbi:MAG: prepilin-type N-terminal cleavage/methylation domain-containing protein [Deltaproteobacteria bacterium]|nr:prepilin-type N-terminal cleavage/methylation domain-containing protein [Deltaproteobacteria bacterium]MBW2068049.1 prepilin-type N-terminal cleavage/methylation domain-containing protein [Deltaproteobacteria bacterium]
MKLNNIVRKGGFTLIELMLVVVIMAILAGVAITLYHSYLKTAFEIDPVNTLLAVSAAQESYYADNGKYASRIEMLPGFNDGTSDGNFVLHDDKDDRRKFYLSVNCNNDCNESYVATVENKPGDSKWKVKWNLSCGVNTTYGNCKPVQVKGSSTLRNVF